MVRLIDIAKAANVSRAIVSAVLNPGRYETIRVAPETAEKIRKIAGEMHYVPNVSARILNGKSSASIGVLLDSGAPEVCVRMLRAIEHEASVHKFRTLVAESHDSAENLFENYMILRQYGVDGVICLSHDYPGQNDKINELFADARDMVFVRGPNVKGQPMIKLDISGVMKKAVDRLTLIGKDKLMLITQDTGSWGYKTRTEGFEKAVAGKNGIVFTLPRNDSPDAQDQETELIGSKITAEKINGVIARNDFDALALISSLQKQGVRVPEDVAVIGNDNEPFGKFALSPLTTIDYNLSEIARIALKMLTEKTEFPAEVIVSPELIVRDSA